MSAVEDLQFGDFVHHAVQKIVPKSVNYASPSSVPP